MQLQELSPAEVIALDRGAVRRFNRWVRLAAWFLLQLRPLVASAVSEGIAYALSKKTTNRPKPARYVDLVRSAPHFLPEADEMADSARQREAPQRRRHPGTRA